MINIDRQLLKQLFLNLKIERHYRKAKKESYLLGEIERSLT